MRFVWIALLLGSVSTSRGQEIISSPEKLVELAHEATFLEDANGSLQLQDILNGSTATRFQPVHKPVINFGISASVFWVKSTIRNESGYELFLKIGNNSLSELQVFETDGNKLVRKHHSGGWLPFREREVKDIDFLFPLQVPTGATATLFIRVKHNRGTQFPLQAGTMVAFYNEAGRRNVLQGIYYGFMIVMLLYNLFLYFSLRDNSYLYYVIYILFMTLFNAAVTGYAFQFLWPFWPFLNQYQDILSVMVCLSGIFFTVSFLDTKRNAPWLHSLLMALFAACVVIIGVIATGNFLFGTVAVEIASLVLVVVFFVTALRVLRGGYKPAMFFLLAWSFLLLTVVVFVLKDFGVLPYNAFTENAIQIGSAVEALLLSMALANRINVYKKEKEAAQAEVLRSYEENRKLITEQNQLLEKKVEDRTSELKQANHEVVTVLKRLQETQAQLIHREKMASLGELTTGIAHEIQNPINFVNNFSEVNAELIDELQQEAQSGNVSQVLEIAGVVKNNEHKIMMHGKRVDAIVKGMLQHGSGSKSNKVPTNINTLAEEYLRLSYNGFRLKDKEFNAALKIAFDANISEVPVKPQEIGQVLLNLYNNAFYAVQAKRKQLNGAFSPEIEVTTTKRDQTIEIQVNDNGTGIPQGIVDKIFQPFFTTKPAGEGTGLGLSLSYEIITKGHGGELRVHSREGEGTQFVIALPQLYG